MLIDNLKLGPLTSIMKLLIKQGVGSRPCLQHHLFTPHFWDWIHITSVGYIQKLESVQKFACAAIVGFLAIRTIFSQKIDVWHPSHSTYDYQLWFFPPSHLLVLLLGWARHRRVWPCNTAGEWGCCPRCNCCAVVSLWWNVVDLGDVVLFHPEMHTFSFSCHSGHGRPCT